MVFMASTKKITLRSLDGKTFDVDVAVALQSHTIMLMIEEFGVDNEIHLPIVTGEILAKVIEYCKKHVEMPNDRASEVKLSAWDTKFVEVDPNVLRDLIWAASCLKIESLLILTVITEADREKWREWQRGRRQYPI